MNATPSTVSIRVDCRCGWRRVADAVPVAQRREAVSVAEYAGHIHELANVAKPHKHDTTVTSTTPTRRFAAARW